jgi:hypothetical protein
MQEASRAFVVLHRGGVDLRCGIYALADADRDSGLSEDLAAALRLDDLSRVAELIEQHPDIRAYSFEDLFIDEQQRILDLVVLSAREEAETAARHLFQKHLASIRLLDDPAHPLSRALQVAAELAINADLLAVLAAQPVDIARLERTLADASSWQVKIDETSVAREIEAAAARSSSGLAQDGASVQQIREIRELVEVGRSLKPPVPFWDLQNTYYHWLYDLPGDLVRELWNNSGSSTWSREVRALGQALAIRLPALGRAAPD